MEEKAAHAVRTKKDSSFAMGLNWCARQAAGFVTAATLARHGHGQDGAGALPAWIVLRWRPPCPAPLATLRLLDVGATWIARRTTCAICRDGEIYAAACSD